MVRWADAIKAYGVPLFLSFNHEPETSVSHGSGTPAEYVLAWRAFVDLFRARGVTNATFAWTTAVRNYSAAPTSNKYAPRYYPGDAWVDVLAVDAYNMYCLKKNGTYSRPWRSLEELLAPFMTFAGDAPDDGAGRRRVRDPGGRGATAAQGGVDRRGPVAVPAADLRPLPGRVLLEPAVAQLRRLRLPGHHERRRASSLRRRWRPDPYYSAP